MRSYNVLIVDDEPATIHFIAKIIELKCPNLKVAATANSGLEALTILNTKLIDIVFTDIIMPEMNGVELVTEISRDYPFVCSVVISGYSDFGYVKKTLSTGAVDYLLKPINPAEFSKLCKLICSKLDMIYCKRRNQFFRNLSQSKRVASLNTTELKQLFPSQYYYAAIIRKNGLVSRFNNIFNDGVYSSIPSQIVIYGRDDLEMLFLYSSNLIIDNFCETMDKEFNKLKSEETFLTMVLYNQRFEPVQLPAILHQLYQRLDNSIVIGKEQKLFLEEIPDTISDSTRSSEQFQYLLYLVAKKDNAHLPATIKKMFELWEQECQTQFEIENKIRHFFYLAKKNGIINEWNEYLLDDAFSNALTMNELCNNILEFLLHNAENISFLQTEKESVFHDITSYMKEHLNGNLSVQNVCNDMAVSPATLNRLFRTYADMSYKNYLTNLRIESSQIMMQNHPQSFIKDVADYVGYKDQFYFSRVFHTITGISPTEYLEQFQNKSTGGV